MALKKDQVTDRLLKRYQQLSRCEAKLTIPGYAFVHPLVRADRHKIAILNDELAVLLFGRYRRQHTE